MTGKFKPTVAVIKADTNGDHIISTISVRNRLIKTCIASKITKIIILVSEGQEKPPYIEYANENSANVEYLSLAEHAKVDMGEKAIYLQDGFLVHTALLNDFLASEARIMKSPTGEKNIFSKDSFTQQAETSYAKIEIFAVKPFNILAIQQHNLREARSRLFKWLSKPSDGYISRTLNRPISTLFSKFFAEYPIHPIYFTGFTALLAILMIYILVTGGEQGILWGCLLFHAASVADGIDGEIARAKFLSSLNGAKIDTTIDMITNILFMGGMSYALWNTYGDEYLILGIYVIILALMGIISMTSLLYFGPGGGRFDILSITIRQRFANKPHLLRIFNFCNYFLKRDAFAFLFAVFALLGLAKYIPEFLIFGLVIWNLAIILNAPSILKSKPVASKV
ncbi:MAG: CDP-alcohol phosphatidyltransferase family protein [Emcibacter sp.]|nr:CDP-alcohol phosphatidyltransferase family protein [Emcibacter sp.]